MSKPSDWDPNGEEGDLEREPEEWERMQMKTFLGWCNVYLTKRELKVEDICKDWDSGVELINLLEVISDQPMGRYFKVPKNVIHKQNNLSMATTFINNFLRENKMGVSYQAQDILDHNRTLILGMIWTLIHKYAIAGDGLEGKEGLLLWCKKNTSGYKGVKIENFSTSWNDGLGFSALIHHFRPDLLDFSKCAGRDSLANLQHAFKVASEVLDIPALLDPVDIAGKCPDAKSIMTYVSFYWKVFSKMESGAVGRDRVATVLGQFRANQLTADDYLSRASELVEWLTEKITEFNAKNYGESLDDIQESFVGLNDYRESDKPLKTAEWRSLATQARSLAQKQRTEHAVPFVAPEGLSNEDIEATWEELKVAEKAYDLGLSETLTAARKRKNTVDRLQSQLIKLSQWCADVQAGHLADEELGDSRSAVEGSIKKHEAFAQQLTVFETRAASVLEEGPQYAETAAATEAFSEQLAAVKAGSEERKTTLDERLQAFVDFEATCLHFSSQAEQLNAVYEAVEDAISLPVTSYSVAEVEALTADQVSARTRLAEQEAVMEELVGIEEVFAGAENPFSRFTVASLQEKKSDLEDALTTRDQALVVESEKQQAHEYLRVEFAEQANQFAEWCTQHIRALDDEMTLEGDLEEHLATIDETLASVHQYGEECIAYLQKVNQQMVESGVVDNIHTSHTLPDLIVEYESLKTGYGQKQALIKEKILAIKGMEVTPEQLREFREAFDYFDKDRSGAIDRDEFKMCQESLGQVLSDEEIESAYNSIDKDHNGKITFDEFVAFMVSRVIVTDSYHDVLGAIKTLAGGKDTISEEELHSFLAPEVVDYVKGAAQLAENGEYDYNSLLSSVFLVE